MATAEGVPQSSEEQASQLNPILLEWAKILVVPVSVAIIGSIGAQWLSNSQSDETNARLYAELLSKREEADSGLRKEMFNLVVRTFLESSKDDPKRRVLALELLAANFHESLDLSPLFKQVVKDIDTTAFSRPAKLELQKRMFSLSNEVIDKQIVALSGASNSGSVRGIVVFSELDATPSGIETIPLHTGHNVNFDFRVWVMTYDPIRKEVGVILEVRSGDRKIANRTLFNVGPFDFPMLDNTRLPTGHRVSVVMSKLDEAAGYAELALVYFPSSRASLKDKPYYDEYLQEMLRFKSQRAFTSGGSR